MSSLQTPQLYTQPKVHKDVNQGRSVSSLNCHTTKISEHIDDYHLQPIFQQIPSYVTDTCGFISKLKAAETVPDNSYLVLLNVKSLYTSIPNSEGIEAVKISPDNFPRGTITKKVITTFL